MKSSTRILALIVMVTAAFSAAAADRAEKIRSLMQAQGLVQTFEQQLAASREACQKQADLMMTQALAGMQLPPSSEAQVRQAVREFVDSLQPESAQSIVDSWSRIYGSKFTEGELDQLLAYYTSPLAQKEVQASREALAQLGTEIQESYAPRFQAATAAYMKRLQEIIIECNCRKQAVSGSAP